MAHVFIGLGSNQDREAALKAAVAHLKTLGPVRLSPVYESAAVGFEGEPFLNLVAELETQLEVHALQARLRAIEDALGRRREHHGYAPRPIDLDLLLYDDLVLREEGVELPSEDIERYPFVLRPLAELAGDFIHPLLGVSLDDMRAGLDESGLRPAALDLDDAN
jgi:2-amino-4-hydroxy-6-hydroxymethyldihydropteridine diphosphokinase